jgi:ubiquinone/menaquinone biosynthesis C-methylase UbiE
MSEAQEGRVDKFYARSYDASVPDWPGEIEFYRGYAKEARRRSASVLDLACGTGRIGIRLAQDGTLLWGLDISQHMLDVAREKSSELANARWIQSSMCNFELGEKFGLVIIGGHAFQCLNTPQEQMECLLCIYRHLDPDGRLIVHLDHQDVAWLAGLIGEDGGIFKPCEEVREAASGHLIRAYRAWTYQPATQTAVCTTAWEVVGPDGRAVDRWERGPVPLHCVFRFEMEHALRRAGFHVEDLYGDFFRHPLEDKSPSMIWVAGRTNGTAV